MALTRVTGHRKHTIGKIRATVLLGDQKVRHTMFVVRDDFPMEHEGILGIDFLQRQRAKCDYGRKLISHSKTAYKIKKAIADRNQIGIVKSAGRVGSILTIYKADNTNIEFPSSRRQSLRKQIRAVRCQKSKLNGMLLTVTNAASKPVKRDALQTIQQIAKQQAHKAKTNAKIYADRRTKIRTFKVGDLVLSHDETLRRGRSKKLEAPWVGPAAEALPDIRNSVRRILNFPVEGETGSPIHVTREREFPIAANDFSLLGINATGEFDTESDERTEQRRRLQFSYDIQEDNTTGTDMLSRTPIKSPQAGTSSAGAEDGTPHSYDLNGLLLSTGAYVWKCVVRCPASLEVFLKSGGLYSMLDIIEIASYHVKCLYLGALTDVCDRTFCGPCLCTWRGADKETGLMSLLAIIWREEEDRIGIKRGVDGTITDSEYPQMGTKQWTDTYRSQLTANVSPAIIEMFGSVRSKIFSILKIIERDGDKYEIAREHYKILLDGLPTRDRITLCCVDMYLRLKLGQMWLELDIYLEQTDVTPVSVDAHLVAHMVQWHRSWGTLIEDHQRKLVATAKHADELLEMDELVKIRDSRLAPALEALDDVDRIRRTTDRSYMLRKKNQQRQQVREALSFPRDADAQRCHRTFSDKTNVTAILKQHQLIDTSHLEDLRSDFPKVSPVSPPDSPHEEIFSLLKVASASSLFYEHRFTDEYMIESLNR
ncbi:PREDICTED: uncharacterized protein LOC105449458 [Wasmannia auropunctata]|uniref:uncharacterized protein LOC105449458 n=1 Tax=Wasmannia auropunctata TaxID=64793 RepID=UPI0005EF155C|nr:PREDICTED: uncharacterized protein LOC105449458 [Wasmannia auropunctata]